MPNDSEHEFKIESGIPIPPVCKAGRKPKYPFRELSVGDSFFAPGPSEVKTHKAYKAGTDWSRRHGVKFSARAVDGGIRIWRIK